jgi:hypothetical protein
MNVNSLIYLKKMLYNKRTKTKTPLPSRPTFGVIPHAALHYRVTRFIRSQVYSGPESPDPPCRLRRGSGINLKEAERDICFF